MPHKKPIIRKSPSANELIEVMETVEEKPVMPRKDVNESKPTDNPDEVRIYEVVVTAIPFDLRGNQQHRKQGEQVASIEFVPNESGSAEAMEKHFVNLGAIVLITTCAKEEWERRAK